MNALKRLEDFDLFEHTGPGMVVEQALSASSPPVLPNPSRALILTSGSMSPSSLSKGMAATGLLRSAMSSVRRCLAVIRGMNVDIKSL